MNSLPIACELTAAELQERRQTVLQKVRHSVMRVEELENGFAFFFSAEGEQFRQVADLVDLERRCCPFLRFQLTVEAGAAPLCLEITGPQGTKEFLLNTFDWRTS